MPVFALSDELVFPPQEFAEPDGLLAVGGDLGVERLLLAYSQGIFPWYTEGSPVLWWCTDPRLVLFPDELVVSRSLGQTLRRGTFRVTFDRAFPEVIAACARVHRGADGGTWITPEMLDAYSELHRLGHAHSAESWHGGKLVGGLYGIALGGVFFGESMFFLMSGASKAAFATLVQALARWGFQIIDCQMTTPHLMSFGAREIPRRRFLEILGATVRRDGSSLWGNEAAR